MNRILAVLAGLAFLVISESSSAVLDFDDNPIGCGSLGIMPPSSSPTPLDCTQKHATSSGYYISNVGWSAILVPPPPGAPGFPGPAVVAWGSNRAFNNPVMQDLLVFIFGDTHIEVFGAPVHFFVTGTLDGAVVVSFETDVAGPGADVKWDEGVTVPNVSAGMHTLDMEFGVSSLIQTAVTVTSLYQVSSTEVPEPSSLALALVGLLSLVRRVIA